VKDYLISVGMKYIWYLVPAAERLEGDEQVGDRRRVVARRLDDWAGHPFWTILEEKQNRG